MFKGKVQRDFRLPFFSSFKPAWANIQWVKLFSIFVKISLSYLNFSVVKIDSTQYDTAGRLTQHSIILRED